MDRDRVREHTSSIDLGWGLFFVSILLAVFGVIYPLWIGNLWWVNMFIWLGVTLAVLSSLMICIRAVLIKRVGIVHSIKTAKLYEIKNVVN